MILPTGIVKRLDVNNIVNDATDGAKGVVDSATAVASTVADGGKKAVGAASNAVNSASGVVGGIQSGLSLADSLQQWQKWWQKNEHTVYVVTLAVGSVLIIILLVGIWNMCTCCYHCCFKSHKHEEKHEYKRKRVAPPQHTLCCEKISKENDDDHIRDEKGRKIGLKGFWDRRHFRIDWTVPARNCGTRHVVEDEKWDFFGRDDNCVHDCWRDKHRCPTWCPGPCKGERDGRYPWSKMSKKSKSPHEKQDMSEGGVLV